jgi:hypothetical protein
MCILQSVDDPVTVYRRALYERHGRFYPTAAALQKYMVDHPRVFSLTGQALTARASRRVLGGAWSMYWNDLIEGAFPGATRVGASAIDALAPGRHDPEPRSAG